MSEQKYFVRVIDHAHYMEEGGEYSGGEFENREEAEKKCREIIDRSLDELFAFDISEEDLLKHFLLYGEEASCEGFESEKYIKARCHELVAEKHVLK